ncbi:general stress protein [Alkalicoccus chagannorensis]|uniref:general stress protein n=1 Tax=Alkalicoccus chagannorensis TaxID=427072 RepID=UPI0003F5DAEC|nr:general stress protein [Alkalicoccus chagannorensis]
MKKRVIGVFSSEEEVKERVDALQLEGHRPEEIVVVAGETEQTKWLRDQTAAKTELLKDQPEEAGTSEENLSFFDKVKRAFVGQTEFKGDTEANDLNEPFDFTKAGLEEEEASHYEKEVKDGSIVVLAPMLADGDEHQAQKEEAIDPGGPSQIGDPMSSEDPAQYAQDAPKFPQDRDVDKDRRDR